ncbi:MAG: DUF3619 family protein [Zoogloeaceae bacterium]|nr:DUF3619 family protein [Zoogloeaceae bacterium]
MNELHFAFRIRQYLNRGLQQIDTSQLDRLAAARAEALSAQKKPATIPALAAAGYFLDRHLSTPGLRPSLAVLALLIAVALFIHWHSSELIDEMSAIDSALLADDVPVEALLDKDFQAWLKNSQAH